MSIVKFMTRGHGNSITQVTVVRETAACVFVRSSSGGEIRALKDGAYDQYHDTWEKAHAELVAQATKKVVAARRQLDLAKGILGNVKGMKNPSIPA